MSTPRGRPGPGTNRLLTLLPEPSRERLLPRLEPVRCELGQLLMVQGDPIARVYFPTTAVLSLVIAMDDGRTVEAAPTGFEGMSGVEVLLGEQISPYEVTVQGAGKVLQVAAADLCRLADDDRALQEVLLRYAQVQMITASRTAACNRLHELEERLARWLLHMHDWIEGDCLELTQDFLATMLGVRRSTVTVAAGALQSAGLITYRRGEITILDREGLEDIACEDYTVIREAFERLLPLPTSDPVQAVSAGTSRQVHS
jgi:CRP-like cAMP-binding protein